MGKNAIELTPEPETQNHLPWHKPGIHRLVVSLDTKNGGASPADIGAFGLAIVFDDVEN